MGRGKLGEGSSEKIHEREGEREREKETKQDLFNDSLGLLGKRGLFLSNGGEGAKDTSKTNGQIFERTMHNNLDSRPISDLVDDGLDWEG